MDKKFYRPLPIERRNFWVTIALFLSILSVAAFVLVGEHLLPKPGGDAPANPGESKEVDYVDNYVESEGNASVSNTLDRQEARQITLSLFPELDALVGPNIDRIPERKPDRPETWRMNWKSPVGVALQREVTVSVDNVNGNVISYRNQKLGFDTVRPVRMLRQEAEKLAGEAVERLAPDIEGTLELTRGAIAAELSGQEWIHTFRFVRLVESHQYPANEVLVRINAHDGQLQGFERTWGSSPSPSLELDSKLNASSAADAYADQVGLELVWRPFNKRLAEQPQWKLVWQPRIQTRGIDPDTGEALIRGGTSAHLRKDGILSGSDIQASLVESNDVDKIDADKAVTLTRSVLGLSDELSAEAELLEPPSGSEQTGRLLWSVSLQSGSASWNAHIDAHRGVLVSLRHTPGSLSESLPDFDNTEGRNRALEFLQSVRPDLIEGLQWVEEEQPNSYRMMDGKRIGQYRLNLRLLEQGVPSVEVSTGNVVVDARTGAVTYFSLREEPMPQGLPDPTRAISAEEAWQSFLTHFPPRLEYVRPIADGSEQNRLAWSLGDGMPALDALTGRPLDQQGQDWLDLVELPRDLTGHGAKHELELALAHGVLSSEGGLLHPDRDLTRGEAMRILLQFLGKESKIQVPELPLGNVSEHPLVPYVATAISHRLLVPEMDGLDWDPDQVVERAEFALYVVRAAKWHPIAEELTELPVPFNDAERIDPRFRNAVALLVALNIIESDGTSLRLDDPLTRAESAVILANLAQFQSDIHNHK